MIRRLRIGMVGGLAVLAAACNPFAVLEGSEEEIAEFHERLAAEEYEAIWNDSSEALQEASNLKSFEGLLMGQRDALGPVQSSERAGFNINTNNGVTTTTITMNTEFEHASGTETFTLLQEGEEWLLQGYSYDTEPRDEADASAEEPAEDAGLEEGFGDDVVSGKESAEKPGVDDAAEEELPFDKS